MINNEASKSSLANSGESNEVGSVLQTITEKPGTLGVSIRLTGKDYPAMVRVTVELREMTAAGLSASPVLQKEFYFNAYPSWGEFHPRTNIELFEPL